MTLGICKLYPNQLKILLVYLVTQLKMLKKIKYRIKNLIQSKHLRQKKVDIEEEYLRLKGYFVLTPKKLEMTKKDMIVMHPLPRVDEIHPSVDADSRAVYFKQAKYGMFIRMALILKLLKGDQHA